MDVLINGSPVQDGEDRVVSRNLDVDHRCPEVRQLEIPELLPIHDVGVKIEVEVSDDPLDVLDRQLGVPTVVEMHH